nr:hypothetical protein [Tanacetum cinerariifolium]
MSVNHILNDMYKLHVLCGRDVEEGKCAGKKGKKTSASVEDKTEGKSASGNVHDKTEGKSDNGSVHDKTEEHNKKNCNKTARPKPINFYNENPTENPAENPNEHPTENPTENQNVNSTQNTTVSTTHNSTQNTTVNGVPTYLQDPVMPKTGQHPSVSEVPSMSNDDEDMIGIALTANDDITQIPQDEIPKQEDSLTDQVTTTAVPTTTDLLPATANDEDPKQQQSETVVDKEKKAATSNDVHESPKPQKKRGRGNAKKAASDQPRIFYKNRGRSERIANQNKPFKFDKNGTGSALDKAFLVE